MIRFYARVWGLTIAIFAVLLAAVFVVLRFWTPPDTESAQTIEVCVGVVMMLAAHVAALAIAECRGWDD